MRKTISLVLTLLLIAPVASGQEPSREIYQKIESSFAVLSDGATEAYGLYIAGARSKKYVYFLSLSLLSAGLDVKLRVTALDGKTHEAESEKLSTDENLGAAIYTVKLSTDDWTPIIRHPDIGQTGTATIWSIGPPKSQQVSSVTANGASEANTTFNLSGALPIEHAGLPVFDSDGKVLGMVASQIPDGSYRVVAISPLLNFAAKVFASEQLDLYPTWDEVYPSQYVTEKVLASSAVLETTSKPGAGFFIGRDKNDVGYLLTAYHVIEGEEIFSVNFAGHEQSMIVGEPLAGAADAGLDLAIVQIKEECPPIKPVILWSPKQFKRFKNSYVDSTEAIANAGRSQSLDNFFQHKKGFIRGENLEGQFLQTDLQLESGDSGGPLFNKNGEVVGINLKTGLQESNLSVANNIETILDFLDDKLKDVDFKVKWEFLQKPSYWSRNKGWIIPVTAVTLVSGGFIIERMIPDAIGDDFESAVGIPPAAQKW